MGGERGANGPGRSLARLRLLQRTERSLKKRGCEGEVWRRVSEKGRNGNLIIARVLRRVSLQATLKFRNLK